MAATEKSHVISNRAGRLSLMIRTRVATQLAQLTQNSQPTPRKACAPAWTMSCCCCSSDFGSWIYWITLYILYILYNFANIVQQTILWNGAFQHDHRDQHEASVDGTAQVRSPKPRSGSAELTWHGMLWKSMEVLLVLWFFWWTDTSHHFTIKWRTAIEPHPWRPSASESCSVGEDFKQLQSCVFHYKPKNPFCSRNQRSESWRLARE